MLVSIFVGVTDHIVTPNSIPLLVKVYHPYYYNAYIDEFRDYILLFFWMMMHIRMLLGYMRN